MAQEQGHVKRIKYTVEFEFSLEETMKDYLMPDGTLSWGEDGPVSFETCAAELMDDNLFNCNADGVKIVQIEKSVEVAGHCGDGMLIRLASGEGMQPEQETGR